MIIPRPASIEIKPGGDVFRLSDATVVVAGPGAEAEAQFLAEALRTPTEYALGVAARAAKNNYIGLEIDPSLSAKLGSEGYRLCVEPTRVCISAATEPGLFYGGITFRQLLPAAVFSLVQHAARREEWAAACCGIEDSPRFIWRGLLLDVARHYMPIEFLRKLTDLLALHKLNTLHLHLTDDQGWRLEIKRYPRLTEAGSVRKESPRKGNPQLGDGQRYGPYFYT